MTCPELAVPDEFNTSIVQPQAGPLHMNESHPVNGLTEITEAQQATFKVEMIHDYDDLEDFTVTVQGPNAIDFCEGTWYVHTDMNLSGDTGVWGVRVTGPGVVPAGTILSAGQIVEQN